MNSFFSLIIPVTVFLRFLIPTPILAAEIPGRIELAPHEWAKYRCRLKDSRNTRWEGTRITERQSVGPPPRYNIIYREEGLFGDENRHERRLGESAFELVDGRLRPLTSHAEIRDGQSRMIRTMEATFDYAGKTVRTRIASPPNDTIETKEFDLEGPMIPGYEIWLLLRGFPYPGMVREGNELTCEILTGKPASYSILFKHEEIEDVTTPAGTFSCHRLRLIPDLGILTWLGKLIAPTIYLWFTVEPPHNWIKYSGPESGPGTPGVVIELVESGKK